MVQFRSFEEGLALLGALVAFLFAYKLFRASLLLSSVIGGLTAAIVAYATLFEFTFDNDVITYRNRFRQVSFPLAHVQRVGMHTFWAGLPGRSYVFVMHRPPAPVDGRSFRTGLVSWPSANGWVEAVNSAIQDKSSAPSTHRKTPE